MSGNACVLWADLMGTAFQRSLNLAATVAGHAANVANAAATGGHLPNQPVCIGMAALSRGYGCRQTACHRPYRGIFACYCRIFRFALYSVHGNGDSKR